MNRSALLAALVCIATSTTGALAQEAPVSSTPAPAVATAPKPVIGQPVWRRRPTAAEFTRAYPSNARRNGISGRAVIRCRVNAEGRLERCEIASEDPPGHGFGEAAIKLSTRFLMSTPTREGVPVTGASVTIPLMFRPPGAR